MAGFYFVYGDKSASKRQDYPRGFTFVHAPNVTIALALWKSLHQVDKDGPIECEDIISDYELASLGLNEDGFGVCHDTIIYQDRKE